MLVAGPWLIKTVRWGALAKKSQLPLMQPFSEALRFLRLRAPCMTEKSWTITKLLKTEEKFYICTDGPHTHKTCPTFSHEASTAWQNVPNWPGSSVDMFFLRFLEGFFWWWWRDNSERMICQRSTVHLRRHSCWNRTKHWPVDHVDPAKRRTILTHIIKLWLG